MPDDILEIPTSYGPNAAGKLTIKTNQSGNTITITDREGGQRPRELIYQTLTHWIFRDVSTASQVIPPGSGSGTFGGTAGTLTYHYVITSIDADDRRGESGVDDDRRGECRGRRADGRRADCADVDRPSRPRRAT